MDAGRTGIEDTRTTDLTNRASAQAREDIGSVAIGDRIGRYVVIERVGAGGMGIVYAAHDEELDRRIALKLVWPGKNGERAKARLIREARALARVNHPNVVEVYDVGPEGRHVFIAMEFVDGVPLSHWVDQPRRTWQEIVAVFVQAGRGLAAAHASRLLHRDFKPDNVLVGRDGRARVTDFGLARAVAEDGSLASASEVSAGVGTQSGEPTITREGSNPGTPRYMAPEQHQGESIDAAADQFAFCVALFEALCDVSPFSARNYAALGRAKQAGLVDPPWPDELPPRLTRAIERGLSPNPRNRFASMTALLRELEGTGRSRVRALAWVVAVGAVGLGTAAVMMPSGARAGCDDQPMDERWNPAEQAEIEAAFSSTSLPYAKDAWSRLRPRLDAHAAQWSALHESTCSELEDGTAADGKMACLEVRKIEIDALLDVLVNADQKTVESAGRLVQSLTPIADCAAGASVTPLPADAVARAEVTAIRTMLTRARALEVSGQTSEASEVVEGAVRRARASGFPPVAAEAIGEAGSIDETMGRYERSAQRLEEATLLGMAHGHDLAAARAATKLTFVLSARLARYDEAHKWARHARAALDRLGSPEDLEAKLAAYMVAVLAADGEFDQAIAGVRDSLHRLEAAGGRPELEVATLTALGTAAFKAGRLEEAQDAYERALALGEDTYGPRHPHVALYVNNLGSARGTRGDVEGARELFERALGIWRESLGDDHPEVARAYHNLGVLMVDTDEQDVALKHFERALEIRRQTHPGNHPEIAESLHSLAGQHKRMGRFDDAKAMYGDAIEMMETLHGPDDPEVSYPVYGLGLTLLETQEFDAAVPLFRRALRLGPRLKTSRAEAEFGLAIALIETGGDRKEALALADKARNTFASAGLRYESRAQETAGWLAEQRGASIEPRQ